MNPDYNKKIIYVSLVVQLAFFCTILVISCNPDNYQKINSNYDELLDPMTGGETTISDATSHAFATPAPNLSTVNLDRHFEGDVTFEATFVTAPAQINSGLGPIFNNTSCINCHIRNGRGKAPSNSRRMKSMLLRMSLPKTGQEHVSHPIPVPGFGTQLNDRANFGRLAEGKIAIDYSEKLVNYNDGHSLKLRVPDYKIYDTYQPLPKNVQISPRVAAPVFGLGLLEAIEEQTILKLADEDDQNNDGISGRPNYVLDVQTMKMRLGRFGWKANEPSLLQQVAEAYRNDMGISNSLFPTDTSEGQKQFDLLQDDPEISDNILQSTTFYVQSLAVPARRDLENPEVKRGAILFSRANCTSCHVPTLKTGRHPTIPEISDQLIHPYTDLLLHDMGEDLADNRNDFIANGREWRTPPLWGIGLTYVINGHTNFLHDGRARNLAEAILWHGGEAEKSRDFFLQLPSKDREALIAFLESL